ncbi:MAG: hypothetical protein K8T25_05065 [Planctomycetia bacterium]|nr:hypothetical protein [Planctomycetia bacterium]
MTAEERGESSVNPFAASGALPKDEALPTPHPVLMTISVLVAVASFAWGATVGVAVAAPHWVPQVARPLLTALRDTPDVGPFEISGAAAAVFGMIVITGVFGRSPTAADLATCYFLVGTMGSCVFGFVGVVFLLTDDKAAAVSPLLRYALALFFAAAPLSLGSCAWMTLRWRNELRRFRERYRAGVAYEK